MKKMILFVFALLSCTLYSQVVFEDRTSDVYSFLRQLSVKGIIEFDDNITPVPRIYIAEKLKEAVSKQTRMTHIEQQELSFYLKDYMNELNFITDSSEAHFNYISRDPSGRYRLLSYSDTLFKINASPILGYETGSRDGKKLTHSWNGLGFYGYLSDYIGFSFNFRDNNESGDRADRHKLFTPETGVIVAKSEGNSFQYSEIHANISANWSWGSLTVGKDFLGWGQARSGNIVLSDKAPSFPFIRLDVRPAKWLSFNYIHAWLASDITDSAATYPSYRQSPVYDRTVDRSKYLAAHTITFYPYRGLSIALGESIVYADKLEISYMMPLMFFRLADHYLSQGSNNKGANVQFFANVSSKNHIKNTHLYGTIFIDEITIEGLFDKQKQRNQFGFTLGTSVTDLPLENLTLTAEFTKIYPFVYRHYIPTLTYESSSYGMGHWMGHNSDLIYVSADYKILRGLKATAWAEFVRKGEDGKVDWQYEQPQPVFLFGLNREYAYAGLELKYQITHELFARAGYRYNQIKNEVKAGDFVKDSYNDISFALYYGI